MKKIFVIATATLMTSTAAIASPMTMEGKAPVAAAGAPLLLAQTEEDIKEQPLDKSQATTMDDASTMDNDMDADDSAMTEESGDEAIETEPLEKNQANELEEAIEANEDVETTDSDDGTIEEQPLDQSQSTPSED